MKKPSLREQLKEALHELEHKKHTAEQYYERLSKAENDLKEYQRKNVFALQEGLQEARGKAEALFEIIRWMINPEATKDPFNEMERRKQKNF